MDTVDLTSCIVYVVFSFNLVMWCNCGECWAIQELRVLSLPDVCILRLSHNQHVTGNSFIFGTHHNISDKLRDLTITLNLQEVSHNHVVVFWSLLWAMRK